MKYRKFIIRAVALLLAVLMGVSVLAVLFNVFSADESLMQTLAQTGNNPNETKWPLYVGVGAVLLIIILVVVPMISKKK